MDEKLINNRAPVLAQVLAGWRATGAPPTWAGLTAELGGVAESLCLIGWPDGSDRAAVEWAGAQATIVYGAALEGASAAALTPGRSDGVGEARHAQRTGRPFTVEDTLGDGKRIARLYLPLADTSPAVACAVARLD